MSLSQAERDQFYRDGFLILDFRLEASLLDSIITGLDGHYGQPESGSSSYDRGIRIQDAWRFEPHVRRIALDSRILSALQDLFGRKPLPFQTLNFPVGTEQKIHSDTIHFNSQPGGYMAGVWVALEDVDLGNGALKYYPGSHHLPEITMFDVGVAPQEEQYPAYENHIESMIASHNLEPVDGIMEKGQIFIWHANLLHGGGRHPDRARSRHSQVTHYFFEGCRYYTPMLSSDTKTQWRDPDWINMDAPARMDPPRQKRRKKNPFSRIRRRLKGGSR